jgi:drug/metabolite transporter (DMT)-like permease
MISALARRAAAPLPLTILAFACIYLIWGSTYLAIRFAIETIEPFTMVGIRFLLAGSILYAWAALRGQARRPSAADWRAAALYGSFFFVVGNGGVTWSEQRVPSGVVAILVAAVPLWIAILEALRPGGPRPTPLAVVGLVLGFGGIAVLIGPGASVTEAAIDPLAAVVMVLCPVGWAYGSVHARHAPHPPSIVQTSAMQMLAGGAAALVLATVLGEWGRARLDLVSAKSALSFVYLVVLGSVVAFSAYAWLLRTSGPSRAGTYAYVNPVVAVFLGWTLGSEPVTPRVILAGGVVVIGVVLILRSQARASAATPAPSGDATPA